MLLYHITPAKNLPSVHRDGLESYRSRGKIKGVWLTTRARLPWALAHVAAHQGVDPMRLCVLIVRVSRRSLTRRRKGVYTYGSVRPLPICGRIPFAVFQWCV